MIRPVATTATIALTTIMVGAIATHIWNGVPVRVPLSLMLFRCFRHQLLLPRPYLVLTKPLRLDIQCQRGASVKIGWKYLDD